MRLGKYVLKALVLYVQLVQELRKEPVDEEDQDGDEEEADEDAENREIQDWLRTLQAIDPMRRGRYQDLGKSPRS